jgi:hypothetical protein
MRLITSLLKRFGYTKESDIKEKLNYARSVAKRLDEHRETVEAIAEKTSLFNDFWHVTHMATQDDYLMRIYHLVHGHWPIDGQHGKHGYVRKRPELLGVCKLPEFTIERE